MPGFITVSFYLDFIWVYVVHPGEIADLTHLPSLIFLALESLLFLVFLVLFQTNDLYAAVACSRHLRYVVSQRFRSPDPRSQELLTFVLKLFGLPWPYSTCSLRVASATFCSSFMATERVRLQMMLVRVKTTTGLLRMGWDMLRQKSYDILRQNC